MIERYGQVSAEIGKTGWTILDRYRYVPSSPTLDQVSVVSSFCGEWGYHQGSLHSTGSYVQTIRAQNETENDGSTWLVEVNIAPRDTDQSDSDSPLNEPTKIMANGVLVREPLWYDVKTGKTLLNTAGVPYAPTPEVDRTRCSLSLQRNISSYPYGLFSYRDCINSGGFMGWGARQVKVGIPNVENAWYTDSDGNRHLYFVYRQDFDVDPNKWQIKLTSMGLQEVDEDSGELKPILHGTVPITEQVLLDRNGKELEQGGEPVIQTFNGYPETSFSFFSQIFGV